MNGESPGRSPGHVFLLKVLATAAVLMFTCVPSHATVFQVQGQGILDDDSPLGTPGETITFSFTYDDAQFGPPVPSGGIGVVYTTPPITVSVQGSISGALTVDAIDMVAAFDSSFDQWNFESGINGRLQANAFGADPFGGLIPASSFVDLNAVFVAELAAGVFQSSGNLSFGLDQVDTGSTLGLEQAGFTVTAMTVPAPATVALFGLALAGIGGRRRRPRTR